MVWAVAVAHIQASSRAAPAGIGLETALASNALWPKAVRVVGNGHICTVAIGWAVHGFETIATIECGIAQNRANWVVGRPVNNFKAGFLLDIGQQVNQPATLVVTPVPSTTTHFAAVGQLLVVTASEVVHGKAKLLQVVGAAHAVSGLAHLLHSGNQ